MQESLKYDAMEKLKEENNTINNGTLKRSNLNKDDDEYIPRKSQIDMKQKKDLIKNKKDKIETLSDRVIRCKSKRIANRQAQDKIQSILI